jgi:AcrR family transcriptional regulator
MLPPGPPKFRRRKADRADEIVAAALEVFVEKGFAAARLDDIAARAGVSKGAIYLYFATKQDIFWAVVETAVAPNIKLMRDLAQIPTPFADRVRQFAAITGPVATHSPIGGIVKMILSEARNFPELGSIWHERTIEPVLTLLCEIIEQAQARGEVRPGDPRLFAMGMVAPTLVGVMWRETFVPIGAQPFDITALAQQHAETVLRGMTPDPRP